jgi:O-antigen/teichoic acid export membrane protein
MVSDSVAPRGTKTATRSVASVRPVSLRRRLASGAALEAGAALLGMLIRLGSSLILTRLLFPAAFGLSALVVTVITGLIMVSDLGIAPAVLRSPRGDQAAFLGTAYTLQVLRSSALALLGSALGWPVAYFMGEPLLLWLMPAGALVLWIHGLCSMRVLVLRRALRLAPLAALELGSQCFGALVTIAAARGGLGVWALVWGAISGAVASTAASFVLPASYRDRFAWDSDARSEIVTFGRWIMASSALTFAGARGDQLIVARLFGAGALGFYNVALALSEAVESVVTRVSTSVIYPVFAALHNREPRELRAAYYRTRLAFDALAHGALGGLCGIAGALIALLYDARYAPVGPMLQALATRASLSCWATACEIALLAQGLSMVQLRRNAAVTAGVVVGMPIGFWLGGTLGLLWATAAARVLAFAVLFPLARRQGLFAPLRELLVPGFFLAGWALGLLLSRLV